MQKGFYSSLDIDKALYRLIDQNNSDIDGMVFLHGACGIFAMALHDTFNYDIGWILDDDELNESDNPWHHLVHIFCYHETRDGTVIYVDIRGSQTDADKFEDPFEDFFVEPQYEFDLPYDDIRDNICMDMSIEEFSAFYNAAVHFIAQERDIYSPKSALEMQIQDASARTLKPQPASHMKVNEAEPEI